MIGPVNSRAKITTKITNCPVDLALRSHPRRPRHRSHREFRDDHSRHRRRALLSRLVYRDDHSFHRCPLHQLLRHFRRPLKHRAPPRLRQDREYRRRHEQLRILCSKSKTKLWTTLRVSFICLFLSTLISTQSGARRSGELGLFKKPLRAVRWRLLKALSIRLSRSNKRPDLVR